MRRDAIATALLVGVSVGLGGAAAVAPGRVDPAPTFAPPPDTAIPAGPLGDEIRLGERIFTDTATTTPRLTGGDLKCSNCHLDAGRRPGAAPLWAAYGLYPQYRRKNRHVNTFAERIAECFLYSMNGRKPSSDDPAVVAVQTYAAFLASGASLGAHLPGQGYARLAPPHLAPDLQRGRLVYGDQCSRCHGADGSGIKSDGEVIFPPVWGRRSYNWGAGMADVGNAAAFVRANMPQDHPGALDDQQAWDVAAYIDSRPRPQDPRWTRSASETRRRFHDDPLSFYGMRVDGLRLGGDGPPHVRAPPSAIGDSGQ